MTKQNQADNEIYEVLVGATADGTSISTLCERSEDSCSGNNLRYHLRTKLDPDTVKSVGNTLLREYTLEMLPEQVEIVVDFDFDVKAVYVDREFYDGKCLTLMQAHNHAYVVPVVWRRRAGAGVASGGGRSRNSVAWVLAQHGMSFGSGGLPGDLSRRQPELSVIRDT